MPGEDRGADPIAGDTGGDTTGTFTDSAAFASDTDVLEGSDIGDDGGMDLVPTGDPEGADSPGTVDADASGDSIPASDADDSIPRHAWFLATPSSSPTLLPPTTQYCVQSIATFRFDGPAHDPWVITFANAAGSPLPSVPPSGPGELVPEYLGGGEYSDVGYATVYAYELPPEAAVITIDIGGERWVITNTCPGPLLHAWLYEAGIEGTRTAIDGGGVVCPQPTPWTLAIEARAGSSYQVLIFDFDTSDIIEHHETSLPQNGDGLVALPALPAWGRVELNLLDANGQEVETLAIYLEC